MRLHVYVKGKLVAHLYRQADDYALRYTADALDADFASPAHAGVYGALTLNTYFANPAHAGLCKPGSEATTGVW